VPYTTCVAGSVITASWANASIRDQVITPFVDASTRDAAILAPVEGMVQYLKDTKRICYHNGTAWCWNPGAVLAWADRQSDSSSTTSEVGVLRLPVGAVPAGQALHISTSSLRVFSDANDIAICALRYTTDGTAPTTGSPIMATSITRPTNTSYPESKTIVAIYTPAVAVTLTLLLTVSRYVGAGNVKLHGGAAYPIAITVYASGTGVSDTGVDI